MKSEGQSQPPVLIIKKKRIVSGNGHHGGAWKVAYADFVTAMMAFFLLMWLLNATTEEQRKGLADYFNPSIPISKVSGGGHGALNGSSVMSDNTLIDDGMGMESDFPRQKPHERDQERDPIDAGELETIANQINEKTQESLTSQISNHVQMRMTPDGLVIEITDADGQPLYTKGSHRPSQLLADLLAIIGPEIATVSNDIAISGHTDALTFRYDAAYTNWELSTDRANAARRLLIANGIPRDQIVEITGKADTQPISDDPRAPQNRRISITLLQSK